MNTSSDDPVSHAPKYEASSRNNSYGPVTKLVVLVICVVLITMLLKVVFAVNTARKYNKDLSHLRTLSAAIHSHAADNNNVLPNHPRDVVTYAGGIASMPREIFISPLHRSDTVLERGEYDGVAVRYGSYVFLLCGEPLDAIDDDNPVLVYTAKVSDRQAKRSVYFLYGGGASMEEPEFRALLPPEVDVDALDGP